MYHTIVLKSMRYRSLTMPRSVWSPPKRTAQWLSTLVNVKLALGGGLVPLSVGKDQRPTGDYASMCAHSMNLTMTTLTDVKDMKLIAPSSPISEPGVPGEC